MSSFCLIIQGAPYTSLCSLSAYKFATAALQQGHTITRLFFYQDGVHNASRLIVPPRDDLHLPNAWQELIATHRLDAVVCSASAQKRGVISNEEAAQLGLDTGNLLQGFTVSGLGQLVDGYLEADRLLNFAP